MNLARSKPGVESLHILAADDSRTNLSVLQAFLEKLGHRVSTAANGVEAVDAFARLKPDLVLLDIMMPVMDGFEAARRIKAMSTAWVPVIFLSALERDKNLLAGLDAGGDDYLGKPFNFVLLEAKLRSVQKALQFQREAIEARERTEKLSDSILDAIITIDSHGRILQVNPATEVLFGWKDEELIGRNVALLMPEPHRSAHDLYLREYLAGGPPHVIGNRREVEAVKKDGSCFPVEIGISELRRENGERLFIGILRDVSERRRTLAERDALYQAQAEEHMFAKQLIELQLHRSGLKDARVHYWIAPAAHFSGDMVAAATSADDRRYALLADATGHGLAAAISVLPLLALFYRMTAEGLDGAEIIGEFNRQLRESIPTGRFVALSLVCLADEARSGQIWVCGTPEAVQIDAWGRITARFPSTHLPLGIVDNATLAARPQNFTWEAGAQILLYSDGLIEAANAAGTHFAHDGLVRTLAHTPPAARRDALVNALKTHLDGALAQDDISFLLLDLS